MGAARFFFLFTLVVIYASYSSAQSNRRIDSLTTLLRTQSNQERFETLNALAIEHLQSDLGRSLALFDEARSIADDMNDTLKMVKSSRRKGQVLIKLGYVDEAIATFQNVIDQAKTVSSTDEYIKIVVGLGLACVLKGKYDDALRYNFEALDFYQRTNDKIWMRTSLINVALTYYKLKDYEKALFYNKKCLEIEVSADDDFDSCILFVNMGLCYAYMNDFVQALKHVNQGLQGCGDQCSNGLLHQAFFALGVIYFRSSNVDSAEYYFQKSYYKAQELNEDIRFQFDNIYYLSQIYLAKGDIVSANKYLKDAEALIKRDSTFKLELIKIYSRFLQLYGESKDFEKIAHYQQKYILLKDRIFSEDLTTNLMKIEVKHLEREHRTRIASQNQVLALKEEAMKRQKILNIVVGSMAIMLFLIVFILMRSVRQKQRINFILDEKVKHRTVQLQSSYDEMLRANAAIMLAVERDSRDIRSSVSTLKGLCNLALLEGPEGNAMEYVAKIDSIADEMMVPVEKMLKYGQDSDEHLRVSEIGSGSSTQWNSPIWTH